MKHTNKILLLFVFILAAACNPYAGLTTPAPTATATGTAAPATSSKMQPVTPTPARVCIVSTGYQAGNLNIRSGAGTSYAVIGILREGQRLTLTDEPARAGWLNVTAANVTGWINKTYCRSENKTSWKR